MLLRTAVAMACKSAVRLLTVGVIRQVVALGGLEYGPSAGELGR